MMRRICIFILACAVSFLIAKRVMADNSVKIISPTNNEKFFPGQQVHVKVQAPENSSVMIMAGPYDSALLEKSPYEFTFTIPHDAALRKVGITAGGVAGVNDFSGSDEVSILVVPPEGDKSHITEIQLIPDENPIYLLYFSDASEKSRGNTILDVYAVFSDGVTREISSQESGTRCVSFDESVFTIGREDGRIVLHPVNIGKANLTVSNGSSSKVVEVIVRKAD